MAITYNSGKTRMKSDDDRRKLKFVVLWPISGVILSYDVTNRLQNNDKNDWRKQ